MQSENQRIAQQLFDMLVSVENVLWMAGQGAYQNDDLFETLCFDIERLSAITGIGVESLEEFAEDTEYLASELVRKHPGFFIQLRTDVRATSSLTPIPLLAVGPLADATARSGTTLKIFPKFRLLPKGFPVR